MTAPQAEPAPTPVPGRALRRIGLGVLVVGFVVIALYVWRTGAITAGSIEAWLESLGAWGPVVFVGAFVLGSAVGLPGMAFVIGGRLAFGPAAGFALGYGGGLVAVTLPFVLARLLRRNAAVPWRPRNRWLSRAFALLETHPVRAVILLRLTLWFNPPLSYALALTRLRFRDYAIGCAVALAPVVAVANIATGWFA